MPLEVNSQNLFQNAQFRQFVDFAETQINAGKQRAVARIDAGDIGEIANRTIKPGSGDWVGIGAGRLASQKRANNATREAFRNAVANMFGGENHIPDSVKEAMKLEDYGKGKPLTARRILAVKTAVESFAKAAKADIETSVEEVVQKLTSGRVQKEAKDAMGEKVREILGACTNATELEVLTHCIEAITVRGDAQPRSVEDIDKRGAGIKANIKELHEVAKGNQEILKAGKFMIKSLNGKSLPPGQIATLTALGMSKDVQLDDVKRIKASSGPVSITRALIQLERNFRNAMKSSGIEYNKIDGELALPMKDFVTRLMIVGLGKGKLRDFQKALAGKNEVKLCALQGAITHYSGGIYELTDKDEGGDIGDEEIQEFIMGDRNKEIPKELEETIKEVFQKLIIRVIPTLGCMLDDILGGVPPLAAPPSDELPVNSLTVLEEIKDWVYESGLVEPDLIGS
ncbi:MAG: hypothetical protein IJR99_14220 [Kiritimatiellae bacterium]|nr:hypothetical protein [Kiritimatiellia bacterium]